MPSALTFKGNQTPNISGTSNIPSFYSWGRSHNWKRLGIPADWSPEDRRPTGTWNAWSRCDHHKAKARFLAWMSPFGDGGLPQNQMHAWMPFFQEKKGGAWIIRCGHPYVVFHWLHLEKLLCSQSPYTSTYYRLIRYATVRWKKADLPFLQKNSATHPAFGKANRLWHQRRWQTASPSIRKRMIGNPHVNI